jgi:hypothetical protein
MLRNSISSLIKGNTKNFNKGLHLMDLYFRHTNKKICRLTKKYDIANRIVFTERKILTETIFVFLQMTNLNVKGEVK